MEKLKHLLVFVQKSGNLGNKIIPKSFFYILKTKCTWIMCPHLLYSHSILFSIIYTKLIAENKIELKNTL